MADTTGISWTDHTFNPWWGCTKIAPGCDNCYAAALDKRTGGNYWDVKAVPRRTSIKNWKRPFAWNKKAQQQGVRRKVFCGSMMDWCDKDAPPGARDYLFEIIRDTPCLDWQLLTKRAGNIARCLPADWGDGYQNVWLGVTCENQEYGYPRIEELQKIPARIRFVSAEPLLCDCSTMPLDGIDWVIIGGESGPGYREMKPGNALSLIQSCRKKGVPVFFKQWGGNTRDKGGCRLLPGDVELKEWPKQSVYVG